jgi:3-oxoacyl-[acyl-carrier-protein] synthase II
MTGVVITGTGIVSPLGSSVDEFLAGLLSNTVTVQPAPWVDEARGVYFWYSVVSGFEPTEWMDKVVADGTDLFAQWTLAAAEQCVAQSGLSDLNPRRTAVIHGTSAGGVRALLRAQHDFDARGVQAIDRKTMIKVLPNMAASQISMRWHLHGPQLTITTACASSVDAIGNAARLIADGRVDVAIAGGTEGGFALASGAPDGDFIPAFLLSQISYGMMTGPGDRLRASLPFDTNRSGIVTSEGAAMLVLENEDHARARGARILARVVGYGSLADGFHPSSPEPSGEWEAATMREAQDEAGVGPADIDLLIAHGTATPKGDTSEIRAINTVFGGRQVPLPVISIKGHVGHTGGSSGAMAAIVAMNAMATGVLPNTAGTTDIDPEVEFRVIIKDPIDIDARVVQINSFGFGGQDASMILKRVDD